MSERDDAELTLLEEIFPGDTNPYGTAFGGRILALMDKAAGMVAARFAHADFVTASLDALDFRSPVQLGEIVEIPARVVYTSKHTCGVKVRVYASDKETWERRVCCEGTLFMVAIGDEGRPRPIRQIDVETDEDRAAWNEAKAIHKQMLERKQRN